MKATFVYRFRSERDGALNGGALVCAAVALLGLLVILSLKSARLASPVGLARDRSARVSFSAPTRKSAGNLGALAWRFEPNVGQSDPRVKFLARASNASIFFTKKSIYFSWDSSQRPHGRRSTEHQDSLNMEFAGSDSLAQPIGKRELFEKTNYFIGRNAAGWHTNIPNYAEILYPALYTRVSARIYGGSQGLEYDLAAENGGAVRKISLRISGAHVRLDHHGNLRMSTAAHSVIMRRPVVYQIADGKSSRISGAYKITGRDKVAFVIGKHQKGARILIDPLISVAYTTFLGGGGAEKGNSVAVDSTGAVYVGGTTTLPSFPGDTTTLTDGPATGNPVLFAAKIDTTQTGAASLVYLDFIGGSGTEQGGMVALDNSVAPPNLAIAGWTTSSDFPQTDGSSLNGPSDLTITELNGGGTSVVYSKYFGGSGAEATQGFAGIATDSTGDVFVTSDTNSTDLPIANLAAALNAAYGGGASDGFIAEFAPGSSSTPGLLLYSTYLGINAQVGSTSIAVDTSGHIYVAGFTSVPLVFPFTNAFQGSYGGGAFDGFVMEINPAGGGPASLVYASLLGGSGSDQIFGIALDNSTPPDAYLAGATQSPDLIPSSGVTNAPFQSALAGTTNGFFAVVSQSTGSPVLQYLTYLGGSSSDSAQSAAVVSPTQVYVAGTATSANFPVMCSLQGFSGTQDAFVSEFNPTVGGSSSLTATTLLGGTVTTEANSVTADSAGDAIVFGDTLSPDYPLAGNPNTGFQPTCASCGATSALSDAFLTKVSANANLSGCVAFNPSPANIGTFADGTTSPPLSILLTNVGNANLNITGVTVTGANSTDFSQTNTCLTNSPIAPNGTCDFSVTFSPTIIGPETATLQVTDDGVGSPQTLALNGTGTGVGVTLAPTSLSFPNTAQGQTSTLTTTLTNTGNDALTITGQQQQIQGTNAQDFAFLSSSTCTPAATPTLPPGGSCTIDVQFAPIEPNPPQQLSAQAVVSLTDSINNATQTISVPLSGTEVAATPGILFAPASLSFSSQNVGTATAAQTITVTNNGSAVLAISSIGIAGANPSDFSQTNTCPIAPSTLAINATCSISVVFQPTAAGPRSAAVSVADNASGSPQTVALTGTGTAAGVSLTPSSLTFAGLNPGSGPSAPQTVTLQNTGTGPLTISSVAITGANPSDFAISGNNCPVGPAATLNPGNSCLINVTFNPTATGSRSASLSVSDDATPSPQIVALSGTGTSPAIAFSTGTLQFPSTLLSAQSGSQAVQVKNSGNGPLVITSVTTAGINSGDFQVSGSCVGASGASVTVSPGSTCDIDVNFVPTALGSRNAALSVADNAPASPQQAALMSGTGVDFQLAPIQGGSTSVSISAGETATFSMQANSQGFSGTAQLSCGSSIPAATCAVTPAQINISTSQSAAFSVNIITTARSAIPPWRPFARHDTPAPLPLFSFLVVFFLLIALARLRNRRPKLMPLLLLFGGFLLASCGGGSGNSSPNGTPAGNYTVTITASVSGASRSVNLSVTVQ